ncbi:MAG: TadE family protein [Acidithiobacillus sp.]
MKSMRQVSRSPSQAGAGAVEFLISIPIVLLLILGSLQASLLYQARLQLEVATWTTRLVRP